MAIIFAIGGGAVVGAVIAGVSHDDYSDYSNYSDYDNYSDYSDYAERRKRRIEALKKDINKDADHVNQYKIESINMHLVNESLIKQSGETVSLESVKKDGDQKIENCEKEEVTSACNSLELEIAEIDRIISKIDSFLDNN